MKHFLKRILRKTGLALLGDLPSSMRDQMSQSHSLMQQSQLLLYHTYRNTAACRDRTLPSLAEVGFRCHSQFEEDGILLYIFALIGTTNRKCVEICAGDGVECLTANLILHHGWWGYLFDGNEDHVARGTAYYRDSKETFLFPPKFTQAWITAENVNDVIVNAGVSGDVDLLSLDIDGMDYWIWEAVDCIRPRVVVCESHNVIGPHDALTVPYDPQFRITTNDYHGASLAAMTKLAGRKGYRLIGTHRYGFNAFYVLNGIAEELLPAVEPVECLGDPYTQEARSSRWPKVRDLPWVRV